MQFGNVKWLLIVLEFSKLNFKKSFFSIGWRVPHLVMAANTAMWDSTVASGCQMTTNSCFQIIMAEHWMRLFLEGGRCANCHVIFHVAVWSVRDGLRIFLMSCCLLPMGQAATLPLQELINCNGVSIKRQSYLG